MLTLKAPAKINWFLNVLGLRHDGFHEICSLIQKVALFDTLTFSEAGDLSLQTDAPVPTEENLIYKAAMLLKKEYKVGKGALITLQKEIPMGAGLGGGSSDAATTLLGLNELWSLDLSMDDLCGLAGRLGSDVPFFLYKSMALVLGRGERITSRNTLKKVSILLVKPDFGISTEWSYKKLSENRSMENKQAGVREINAYTDNSSELTKKAGKVNNIEQIIRSIERTELGCLADIVSNDLESVAIERFPVIADIKIRMQNQGALFSLMSGSGSTVFGVFDTEAKTIVASKAFEGYWTAAVQTIIDK